MRKPELLAPVGDMEKLKAAVLYGADAVYLGGNQFGLRVAAANFNLDEIAEAVTFAHGRGVKVYITVNIFAHNQDLVELPAYLNSLQQREVDGIIVADPGVLSLAREKVPGLRVHLSTQANTTNWASALFWEKMGVSRIVLARELSLPEIREITSRVGIEVECFVHGAMCISYSGRCLLSNYMTGRDANAGDCAQACRWRYTLLEEKRPGEYFPVAEDDRGTYILSSRDLCLLAQIPDLVEAGVDSFKIEGRVKSVHYVATVLKVYRQALDAYLNDPGAFRVEAGLWDELGKVSNRDYTTGFFSGRPGVRAQGAVESIYKRPYTFIGVVRGYDSHTGLLEVEQRNRFAIGDVIEVMIPGEENFTFKVKRMLNEEFQPIDAAPHPRQKVYLSPGRELPEFSLLRRSEAENNN